MQLGDLNPHGNELVQQTTNPSTTHPYATIWVMRCPVGDHEFGANSCDAHNRRCPVHQGGRQGEPLGPS